MHPEIFGVIKSYGVLLATSFVLGILLCIRRGRARGLDPDTVLDFCFGVLLSSIVGVRLYFVLTHLADFHPWYRAFYIWEGGLTLYGGIIAATLTVWVLARRRGVPFLRMADVMAPAVVLGIGITRIGCFLNGCCFGRPTDSFLGVVFPPHCPAGPYCAAEGALLPSQLFSSAGGFAVFGLLLLLEKRRSVEGMTFARFLALYGLARVLVDFTRWYEPEMILALGLTSNQWISIVIGLGGVLLMLRLRGGAERAG